MYWIVESNAPLKDNAKFRSFQCDTRADLNDLPTHKKIGKIQEIDGIPDYVSFQKCALGSECLCKEDSSVFILSPTGWAEI